MRYRFEAFDKSILRSLENFKDLMNLFQLLVLKTNGDVERALEFMRSLQQQGHIPSDWDIDAFARKLSEVISGA